MLCRNREMHVWFWLGSPKPGFICMISSFCHGGNEIFALLGRYIALISSYLLLSLRAPLRQLDFLPLLPPLSCYTIPIANIKFSETQSPPTPFSIQLHTWTAWPLKRGPIGCPGTLVNDYQSTWCTITKEFRSLVLSGSEQGQVVGCEHGNCQIP